ncbi:hypothetical protein KIW84_050234 [Lathyrus oleraceus]|uniref:DUF7745 domain-containing protein n=1 Tax=Pisum sativum TaxID=3888 RepID=A0A9D4WIL8_PEA|nr:hypothetical protein KIW84_050234 [Pisum sativum]
MKGRTPYNRIGQVPEVEMLALALNIPISDALANWKKRENLFGFWRAYLEEEAEKLFVIHHWDALANILAFLIYGLVLFPTHEGFIDSAAISIFWAVWKDKQSLVPPLLADTFHTLHTRHQKKNGMLICCLPLLYNWLISYVFKPNAHISEMSNGEWARTLVSLSTRIPYQHWVSERIKVVKLPFSIEIPLKSTSPEPVPVSLEEVEELRTMVAKLGKENDDMQSELYKETGKKYDSKKEE